MVIPEPSSKVKIIEQTNITLFFGILYFFSLISFLDIISFVGIFQVRLFSLSCTSFSIFCFLFFENKLKIKSLNLDIKIPQ